MKKAGHEPVWSYNGPVPRIVAGVGTEHISCMAVLDPQQPYLDHHRPGGDPLLGTVMGIEAMARAARLLHPEGSLTCISDVQIGSPCILKDAESRPRHIEVNARTEHADIVETNILCEVLSDARVGVSERHFAGRFRISRVPPADVDRINSLHTPEALRVTAASIYGLFFHGPWFRVIAEARMLDGALIARSIPSQYELLGGNGYEAAPRVIEFCLQAAGLFRLAETGRMMIPRAIRSIERWSIINELVTGGLIAIARRSEKVERSSLGATIIDVDAVDAEGRICMRVTGYDTYPLPFPANELAAARLQALLNRTLG
jgi:hypothetical protein